MATTKRDYYDVLGVGRKASTEEIKRSFRKLAMQYHPDRNKNADSEQRFKEINEAYEVLSDQERRAVYDRYGHDGARAYGQGGRPFDGFDIGGFGDIFDAFFGGTMTRTQQQPRRGADLRSRVTLTFEEAAFGCEKEIEITRTELCARCGGKGNEPGSQLARCPACDGNGEVRRVQRSVFGQFVNVAICQQCGGQGRIITEPCKQCGGAGRERHRRRRAVKIPGGVSDDSQMRLAGEGDAGLNGGPAGNLYVAFEVLPHPVFQRENSDILLDLKINIAQAALGGEVDVPTLDGDHTLKIPAGTQSGRVFVLKGKGAKHLRGQGRGHELVRVRVVVPTSLSAEQKQLLTELASTLGSPTDSEDDKGLLGKIKGALG
jgi:molecular chaperone DnaJ